MGIVLTILEIIGYIIMFGGVFTLILAFGFAVGE